MTHINHLVISELYLMLEGKGIQEHCAHRIIDDRMENSEILAKVQYQLSCQRVVKM